MNKQTEAIHKALKVLNCLNNDRVYETAWVKGAINACEEALKQPTQEPVAWTKESELTRVTTLRFPMAMWKNKYASIENNIPLYTHPHQWQGLTDDEIQELTHYDIKFARAIEQSLREKNT